ncbi:hypothetical protein ACXZ65_31055 [Streptomyces aculeolatus]
MATLYGRSKAYEILVRLTAGCDLPLMLGAVVRGNLPEHGHVLLGDVALAGIKRKGRWWFDSRDVERAGEHLTSVSIDRRDLAEVLLPSHESVGSVSLEDLVRSNWRRTLRRWMDSAALRQRTTDQRFSNEVDPATCTGSGPAACRGC